MSESQPDWFSTLHDSSLQCIFLFVASLHNVDQNKRIHHETLLPQDYPRDSAVADLRTPFFYDIQSAAALGQTCRRFRLIWNHVQRFAMLNTVQAHLRGHCIRILLTTIQCFLTPIDGDRVEFRERMPEKDVKAIFDSISPMTKQHMDEIEFPVDGGECAPLPLIAINENGQFDLATTMARCDEIFQNQIVKLPHNFTDVDCLIMALGSELSHNYNESRNLSMIAVAIGTQVSGTVHMREKLIINRIGDARFTRWTKTGLDSCNRHMRPPTLRLWQVFDKNSREVAVFPPFVCVTQFNGLHHFLNTKKTNCENAVRIIDRCRTLSTQASVLAELPLPLFTADLLRCSISELIADMRYDWMCDQLTTALRQYKHLVLHFCLKQLFFSVFTQYTHRRNFRGDRVYQTADGQRYVPKHYFNGVIEVGVCANAVKLSGFGIVSAADVFIQSVLLAQPFQFLSSLLSLRGYSTMLCSAETMLANSNEWVQYAVPHQRAHAAIESTVIKQHRFREGGTLYHIPLVTMRDCHTQFLTVETPEGRALDNIWKKMFHTKQHAKRCRDMCRVRRPVILNAMPVLAQLDARNEPLPLPVVQIYSEAFGNHVDIYGGGHKATFELEHTASYIHSITRDDGHVNYQTSVLCDNWPKWKEEPRLMTFKPVDSDERGIARYQLFWDSGSLAPINHFFNIDATFFAPLNSWMKYGLHYSACSRVGKMIDSLPLFETFQQRMMRLLRNMRDEQVFGRVFSLLKNNCLVCGYVVDARCRCAQLYGLPSFRNDDDNDDGDDVLTSAKRRRTQE